MSKKRASIPPLLAKAEAVNDMCTAFCAFHAVPGYALVLIENRDEFHARPTRELHQWAEPAVIGGRDEQAGGAWLAANQRGQFGVLTNYRDPTAIRDDAQSRGHLIVDFLTSQASPQAYLNQLNAAQYNGFNLLLGDLRADQIGYYSNAVAASPQLLTPGVYGLSNALLDTPWPKVQAGKAAFAAVLAKPDWTHEQLFALLKNPQLAPDDKLPNTGMSLEWERMLSALFICSPVYGTRCSTVFTVRDDGAAEITERRFAADGAQMGESTLAWQL